MCLRTLVLLILIALSASPTEVLAQQTDAFGDSLPPGAIARLGTTRLRHPGPIESFCFSPDGLQIASVSFDHLCLWDAKTGKRLHLSASDRERYQAVAYSPDGKLLAIGIGGIHPPIAIFDAKTLKELRRLDEAHFGGGVYHLVFSPDGKTLISRGSDEQLRIWDPHTGKLIEDIQTHAQRQVGAFALSRDGRLLAWSSDDGDIHIRDLAAGKSLRGLCGQKDWVKGLAFSPDGATLASGSPNDGTLRLWDVATGQERWRRKSSCVSVAFSSDGKTLFAVELGNVLLLDPVTGKEITRIPGAFNWFSAARLSPDGKTLAVSSNHAIHLFDTAGKPRFDAPAHDAGVNSLTFSPDGKTLISAAGFGDGSVRIWDPWTGKVLHRLPCHVRGVSGISLSGDGKLLASVSDLGPSILWDTATGAKKRTFDERGLSHGANGVALSPDGKAAAFASGHSVDFLDARTGKWKFIGSREGQGLVGGGDRGPYIPSSHNGSVHAVAFSRDGKLVASGSQDRSVRIWDAKTGFQIHMLAEHSGEVHGVAFSPDGQLVAAAAEKAVCVWHVATGKRLLALDDPARTFWTVAFSPDGRLLAAGGTKQTMKIWEVITGRPIRPFDGHTWSVTALAFAPDGKHLASGSYDSTVLLWNVYDSPAKQLDAKEIKESWARLADEDAAVAHESMSALIASPRESVKWIKENLKPAEPSSVTDVAKLILQLDSPNFTRREQAARALEKSGPEALFALTVALKKAPPVEVRRRIEKIMEKMLEQPPFLIKNAKDRRAFRAIVVLEQIGGPEALSVLQSLAKGESLSRLTYEADVAARRLALRMSRP